MMQPLLRADASEIADCEWLVAVCRRRLVGRDTYPVQLRGKRTGWEFCPTRLSMSLQIQPRIHHIDLVAGNTQILGHEIRVIAARRDEPLHLVAMLADQLNRRGAMR